MFPWQMNSIFIISLISLQKPSNLDTTGFPALFSIFLFCPKPTLFFVNLRIFTGKWCSKWCSNSVRFQPDFLRFSGVPIFLNAGFACVVRQSSNSAASSEFSSLLAQINDFRHLLRRPVIAGVCVDIQRYSHIRVSHHILQGLYIHTGVCHIRTESMAEHMGVMCGSGLSGYSLLRWTIFISW